MVIWIFFRLEKMGYLLFPYCRTFGPILKLPIHSMTLLNLNVHAYIKTAHHICCICIESRKNMKQFCLVFFPFFFTLYHAIDCAPGQLYIDKALLFIKKLFHIASSVSLSIIDLNWTQPNHESNVQSEPTSNSNISISVYICFLKTWYTSKIYMI